MRQALHIRWKPSCLPLVIKSPLWLLLNTVSYQLLKCEVYFRLQPQQARAEPIKFYCGQSISLPGALEMVTAISNTKLHSHPFFFYSLFPDIWGPIKLTYNQVTATTRALVLVSVPQVVFFQDVYDRKQGVILFVLCAHTRVYVCVCWCVCVLAEQGGVISFGSIPCHESLTHAVYFTRSPNPGLLGPHECVHCSSLCSEVCVESGCSFCLASGGQGMLWA